MKRAWILALLLLAGWWTHCGAQTYGNIARTFHSRADRSGLVSGVTALLRATPDNNERNFWRLFERAYGKQMRLFEEAEDDPTSA